MTFLDATSPAATAGLDPAVQDFETDTGELVGIGYESEALDRNYWGARVKRTGHRQFTIIGDISEALYGDRNAWVGDTEGGANPPDIEAQVSTLFRDLEARRGVDPGRLANFPQNRPDLEAQALEQIRTEMQAARRELDERTENRSSPTALGAAAEFVGMAGAAVTDIEGLITLPLGGGSGSLGRTVLVEGALGAGSEAIAIPAYNAQAEFLEREAPDPLQLLLFGASFGAALPVAGATVKRGGQAVAKGAEITNRRLLEFARKAQASAKERGAAMQVAREEAALDSAPPGVSPEEHAAARDQAEQAVNDGSPVIVRPEDIDTPAPANWPQIQAGIFAGESGGDYDALFGFSNRQGGRFAAVRVTQMTVDQAIAFSDPQGAYGQWVKNRIGRVATPMGAYQVVGTTLRAAKRGLGLTGDEVMDVATQDRIGKWILAQQGTDAWEGYRGPREPGTGTFTGRETFVGFKTREGKVEAEFDGLSLRADGDGFEIEAGEIRIDQRWSRTAAPELVDSTSEVALDEELETQLATQAAELQQGQADLETARAERGRLRAELDGLRAPAPEDAPPAPDPALEARAAELEAQIAEVDARLRPDPDAGARRPDASPSPAAAEEGRWVLVDRDTSRAVMETTDPAKVEALNRDRFAAVPVRDYLETFNQRVRDAGGETPPEAAWTGPETLPPSNQPPASAAPEPEMFDDPVTSPGSQAQIDLIEADLRARLAAAEGDIEVPVTGGEDAGTIRLSDILDDHDDEAEFLEQLKVCMPKGVSNG